MNSSNSVFLDLNNIINNTIEGILLLQNGFIKHINKPLLEILGYDNEQELIGNLATGILIPTSNDKFIKFNSKIFQELSLITKNGEIIPTIIKIKDLKINNDEYKMVSILDLTELKEKEKIVLQQSKHVAMGEMISMIAHQWRQPLSYISSITSRLKLKNNTNKIEKDFLDEKLDEMNNYIQYMSNTIDDFKNFFRKDKQQTHISLNEIALIVTKMLKSSFELENINIIVEDVKMTKLFIFKNDIIQVILNILNNSKDAFNNKKTYFPSIHISFKETENEQFLFIEDNAGGIDNDIINNIFKPYFTTKYDKNGSGLGLYICKIIIERNFCGNIEVINKNDGVLFTIKLIK